MLFEITQLNKYGNIRKRIFFQESSQVCLKNVSKYGKSVGIRPFKYEVEGILPPHLITNHKGQKYIIPNWIPVLPETTLKDIEWTPWSPKVSPPPQTMSEVFEVKSSNGVDTYKVEKKGVNMFKCNCPGYWRAKGNCKHIMAIKNRL